MDYERVVKFNYTSTERFALVEFIAMTKGLAGLMMREDALLSVIIRRAIHDELQEFVQVLSTCDEFWRLGVREGNFLCK